jgi:hypothetical protein
MTVLLHLISGVSFGLEYVSPTVTDDGDHIIVLDLGFLRLLFCWEPSDA